MKLNKLSILTMFSLLSCGNPSGERTYGQGTDGKNGLNGVQGFNSLIKTLPFASNLDCPNGGIELITGLDIDGSGSIDSNSTNVQSSEVCNGVNGTNGLNGTNGTNGLNGTNGITPQFTPVIVITPCGANSSAFKEALLGLQGGAIFAEFTQNSNALTVRNTLLSDGSYLDTDDSMCLFNVSTDNQGSRSVTWTGQASNGIWPSGGANYNALTQVWSQY